MSISRAFAVLRTAGSSLRQLPRWLVVTVIGGIACVAVGFAVASAAASGPVLIYQSESHRYFSPNGDLQDDTLGIYYCLAAPGNVTVTVENAGGQIVRTVESGVSHFGSGACYSWNNYAYWDGRDDNGITVSDGVYTVRVHSVQPDGTTGDDVVQVGVDTRTPGALTSPHPGAVLSGTINWTFTPSAGIALTSVYVYCNGAQLGFAGAAGPDGTFSGSGDTASCVPGANELTTVATWTDPFGHSQYWTAPTVAVTIDNAPGLKISQQYSHRYFSPNGDQQDDSLTVTFCLTKNSSVTVLVTNGAGATVRTQPAQDTAGTPYCSAGNNTAYWDGRDDSGAVVPDGVYTVHVHAVDASDQTGDDSVEVGVDTRTPGTLTSPHAGDVLTGSVTWVFTPTSGFALTSTYAYCSGSSLGSSNAPNPDGTFSASGDSRGCVSGANTVNVAAYWTDPFGATQVWTSPSVAVTVDNPPSLSIAQYYAHRYFSPNGDQQDDAVYVPFCLSKDATVTTTVTDAQGATVRTLAGWNATGYVYCYSANNSVTWDGRDDSGAVVPDGVYTMHLHAVDAGGKTSDDTVQVGVDARTPGALTSPGPDQVLTGGVAWTFTPSAGFPLNAVYLYCSGGLMGSSTSARADGTFGASSETAGCVSGPNTLTPVAYWTDPFGYNQVWSAPAVPAVISNAPGLNIYDYSSHRYFSPNGDLQEDEAYVSYCLSKNSTVLTTVTNAQNTVVRSIAAQEVNGYPSCYSANNYVGWDGRDDSGAVVPDGVYTVHLHAVDGSGQTGDDSVDVGVDSRIPGALIAPQPADTLAGLANFAFQPTEGYPVTTIGISVSTGGSVYMYNPSPDGVWRTTMYTGSLQPGPATVSTGVGSTDPFGQTHWWSAPETPVVIDVTGLPLTVTADPTSGAAPLATTLHIVTSDPQARPVHYSVAFGDGQTASGDVSSPYPAVDLAHTYTAPGAYRAIITVTNAAGAAASRAVDFTITGTSNAAPVPHLALDEAGGAAPLPVSATITATDADNDRLTYRLDFGDGTVDTGDLPHAAVTHTYARAGTYLVRLAVSDGKLTATATTTVVVVLAEPLSAAAGDDQAATAGTPVRLDASASRPTVGIETYHWTFGDGASGDGVSVDHVYAAAGTYTATLTVSADGQTRSDTATITVRPVPQQAGLAVTVTDGTAPLPNASLVVIDATGQRFSTQTDSGGVGHLNLPDGAYTVYGWIGGYLPATATATVAAGVGTVTLTLHPGEVAQAALTSEPLTYDEIVAAGIDPNSPANQNVYEFTINLAINTTTPITFSGFTASGGGGLYPLCPTVDGVATACSGGGTSFTSGGYTVSVSVSYVRNAPQLVWLVIPAKASWLKEFFAVQMAVTNLADPGFVLDHGTATLTLPAGLSLAPTATPQAATTTVADIAGGHSTTATWLVRGDTEGFYDLTASYAASLEPFGDTVTVNAATAKPLHVWGGSAVEITIDVDADIYNRYPYRLQVGLKNVADVPVYNASVELLTQASKHYLYQPREALRQMTAQIDPGATFWTDDYILAPDISGTVDVQSSFVEMTSGDHPPAAKIVSHPPLQTPQTAPTLTATGLTNQIGLLWTAVPGATGYEIYSTPDRATEFPATPVASVSAATTSATLPVTPGSDGWFAVSSIVNGRRTMFHPIVQGIPSANPTVPFTYARLSSTASCGQDVTVTAQFDDPFSVLTNWSATLDDASTPAFSGALSGYRASATFTVKASDIKALGSRLKITAKDSSGTTGQPWSARLDTRCNPIRMMVLGDSIAWGQGLLDNQKYAALVKEWITDTSGRPVVYDTDSRNAAHSGAVVADPSHGCTPDIRTSIPLAAAGEVPIGSPDIGNCQLTGTANTDADLILVDGCLNDIGFMTISFSQENLGDLVTSKCGSPVRTLLTELHRQHPGAQIVYTGYYQGFDISLSLGDLLVIGDLFGWDKAAVAAVVNLGLSWEKDRWAQFASKANTQARQIVDQLDSTGSWLHFADPAFQPGDGVFNIGSKLFLGKFDNVDGPRAEACKAAKEANLPVPGYCPIASFGHPNEAGAVKYADAIKGQLNSWALGLRTLTVTSLTATPSTVNLAKGDTQKLTVTAHYSDGSTGDATGLVTATSELPAVATVDNATLTVKAVGTGTSHITIALNAKPAITTSVTVNVTAAVPRTVTLTPAAPLLQIGTSVQLTATVTMSDGTTFVPAMVTWVSSSTAVATVSGKGVVKAVATGTTTITATYSSAKPVTTVSGSTIVTVLSGPPKITGFTPATGPVGTQVTIQGTALLGVTSVTFNGVAATFTVNSSTSITAVVPAGARTGFIVVTSPLGTDTSKKKFTVR